LRGSDPRILGGDDFAEVALAVENVPPRNISLKQIEAKVLDAYGIDRAAVQSPSQQRHLTEAGATLSWLARETGAGNLKHVARIVNRDAGSLSSAIV
jgi:chromosomal replication initiation ATPase DnaA